MKNPISTRRLLTLASLGALALSTSACVFEAPPPGPGEPHGEHWGPPPPDRYYAPEPPPPGPGPDRGPDPDRRW